MVVDLEGYEGPLDVLLALARTQKVDLAKISILKLADQYFAFIIEARKLSLEVAADYLVMAAWLAYLKSRLLLPEPEDDDELSGPELAANLAWKLLRLEAMRNAAGRLMQRDRLGRDVFRRGMPEGIRSIRHPKWECTMFELLEAYAAVSRPAAPHPLVVGRFDAYTIRDAMERIGRLLGVSTNWERIESFLPGGVGQGAYLGLGQKSAMASTFAASLELTKQGRLRLRQDHAFGPIFIRAQRPESTET
jgi:segregation and condensation protein A